jgi:HEAT repeat protein
VDLGTIAFLAVDAGALALWWLWREPRALPAPRVTYDLAAIAAVRAGLAAAGEQLGLAVEERGPLPRLRGARGDLEVMMEPLGLVLGTTAPFDLKVVLKGPRERRLLLLAPRPAPSSRAPLADQGGAASGDPALDQRYRVRGSRVEALAVLDASTRRALVESRARVTTSDDRLEYVTVGATADAQTIAAELERALALAASLVVPSREAALDTLAWRCANDPVSGVRRAALETLLAAQPKEPSTRAVCLRALEDPAADVRLIAALELGPAGASAAESVAFDRSADPVLRVRALRHRVTHAAADAPAVLRRALDEPALPLRFEAAQLFGKLRLPEGAGPLLALLASPDLSPRMRMAVLDALSLLEPRGVDALIIPHLEHADAGVRSAAAHLLSISGGPESLGALRRVISSGRSSGLFRVLVEQAIRELEGRQDGAAGRLSIADGGSRGRLSLAARTGPSAKV